MEYLHCENGNFEDSASGRVLYGGSGIPNFPVRLLNEIYGRAVGYLEKKGDIVVYDPCCGGGYALTMLGFFHNGEIGKLYGSDIDESMLARQVLAEAFLADCTKELPAILPDIIITDVPYGNLVEWDGGESVSMAEM